LQERRQGLRRAAALAQGNASVVPQFFWPPIERHALLASCAVPRRVRRAAVASPEGKRRETHPKTRRSSNYAARRRPCGGMAWNEPTKPRFACGRGRSDVVRAQPRARARPGSVLPRSHAATSGAARTQRVALLRSRT